MTTTIGRKTFTGKRLWKSRCYKWTVCSTIFVPNIALDQEAVVADIVLALFIFTCFWCAPTHTFNRIRVATKDVVETETARPRPGQNSETETLSNYPRLETCVSISIPRLENLWIMQYFSKKCHHHFEIEFFRISGIFLPALAVSHLQIQQTKGTLNYRNFAMPYRCNIKSLKQ